MLRTINPSCLFLDLGGVLFYDEYVELYFSYQVYKHAKKYDDSISECNFFNNRKTLYPYFSDNWTSYWLKKNFSKELVSMIVSTSWNTTLKNFINLFKPYEKAKHLLKVLSKKYRLFCIANQPYESQAILEKLSFLDYFENIFIDSIVGISKPDLRLFQIALQSANISPKKVCFIGDRVDNDIIPAIKCGMNAIKLNIPIDPVFLPSIPNNFCKAFYKSLETVWHRWKTSLYYEYPLVTSYTELLKTLSN